MTLSDAPTTSNAVMATTEYVTSLSPDYGNLPLEIIMHIFRFLNHSDLLAAGATCSRWRAALLDGQLNGRTLVRFAKDCVSDRLPPAVHFGRATRLYRSLYLEEVTVGQINRLATQLGQSLWELTFDNVDMTEKQFYAIMRSMPLLRRLTITRCSQLFMPGSFLDNGVVESNGNPNGGSSAAPPTTEAFMTDVRHLSLRQNQYLSDAILQRITAYMTHMESLDLSGCYIAYHNALQTRFYPKTGSPSVRSDSILTFRFIQCILEMHREHVRELNLSHTLIGGPALRSLCDMENGGLQLERLFLASCRQLNAATLKEFLATQGHLLVLDLADVTCVNDDCLACVVAQVPRLEQLNISGCAAVTDVGAAQLGSLERLRCLNISRCGGITSEGLTKGVAQAVNSTLRELHMTSLKVCDECVKCVARNLPELRVLNVSNCVNGVVDEAVQCIIEHLRWLRELSLEDCCRVTDIALTGINLAKMGLQSPAHSQSQQSFNPPPTSSLSERDSLNNSICSLKISLRSKAEEDIIRDASRKKAMLDAYELNLIDADTVDRAGGHSIQELRGLRALNLKGCNKITDVSLKYGLQLIELRRLNLSNCQQISHIGMEQLVSNCPSIEELDLSDCNNITDKAIQVATTQLQRLRSLHISGCTQLTDHSLDAILVNCKALQALSVYRCRLMYTDIEARLAELPTLRHLNMDNKSTLDNAEMFRRKKGLDY